MQILLHILLRQGAEKLLLRLRTAQHSQSGCCRARVCCAGYARYSDLTYAARRQKAETKHARPSRKSRRSAGARRITTAAVVRARVHGAEIPVAHQPRSQSCLREDVGSVSANKR
jgi:hypothetical protein